MGTVRTARGGPLAGAGGGPGPPAGGPGDDIRVAVLIRLVAATGMRRGEACALRWNDIDTKAGTVMIDEGVVSTEDGAEARSRRPARARARSPSTR